MILPVLVTVAAVLCSGLLGFAQESKQKAAAGAKPAAKTKAEYIGSETCQGCHEDVGKAFRNNPHQLLEKDKQRGWEAKACESCHGPGSIHAESTSADDIRNPSKLAPAEVDRNCLSCHRGNPTHAGRIMGGHARNEVGCTGCHTIHGKDQSHLYPYKASEVNKKCESCHISIWTSFQRPYHHKLPEGAMSCVDCHNPHGSFRPGNMQTVSGNEPGCLKCHGDKRGPFAFEHAPMRLEGCTACHQPHGSANPHMLTRQEVRFVCLECHSNLGSITAKNPAGTMGGPATAFHDLRSPRYRNCTTCHVKVHGSHVNRAFLR